MQLRRTLLTPAERELLAYDIPQTGPMVFYYHSYICNLIKCKKFFLIIFTFLKASILATIILTLIVHELQFLCEIENYSTAIFMNFFLWIGKQFDIEFFNS